jgi:hypothetical protein
MTKTNTWQTWPLFREGAPNRQNGNFQGEKKIWSNVQDLGLTPRHTDWLTDRQSQCGFDFGTLPVCITTADMVSDINCSLYLEICDIIVYQHGRSLNGFIALRGYKDLILDTEHFLIILSSRQKECHSQVPVNGLVEHDFTVKGKFLKSQM